MEMRVQRLEGDVAEIKSILGRLEPMIASQSTAMEGLRERMTETRDRLSEMRDGQRDTQRDVGQLRDRLAETREEMKEMRGELKGLLPTRTFVFWMISLFVALAALVLRAA